jgi:hypothetical protein
MSTSQIAIVAGTLVAGVIVYFAYSRMTSKESDKGQPPCRQVSSGAAKRHAAEIKQAASCAEG